MAEVTSETFAARLLRSVEQAAKIKAGGEPAAKVIRRKVTARRAVVTQAPRYDRERIAQIRQRFGVSQPVFAEMLGVKSVTVKAWEQGTKSPSGPARRLLQVAEAHPAVVAETVGEKS